jgi:hypothetical protein
MVRTKEADTLWMSCRLTNDGNQEEWPTAKLVDRQGGPDRDNEIQSRFTAGKL